MIFTLFTFLKIAIKLPFSCRVFNQFQRRLTFAHKTYSYWRDFRLSRHSHDYCDLFHCVSWFKNCLQACLQILINTCIFSIVLHFWKGHLDLVNSSKMHWKSEIASVNRNWQRSFTCRILTRTNYSLN